MTLAPALVALAWTLIHSLWQAAAISGVVAWVRRRCTRAELRYALCFGGVLATLAASLVNYVLVYPWGASSGVGEAALLAALVAEGSNAALPYKFLCKILQYYKAFLCKKFTNSQGYSLVHIFVQNLKNSQGYIVLYTFLCKI